MMCTYNGATLDSPNRPQVRPPLAPTLTAVDAEGRAGPVRGEDEAGQQGGLGHRERQRGLGVPGEAGERRRRLREDHAPQPAAFDTDEGGK